MTGFVRPSDAAMGAGARWRLAMQHTPRGGSSGDELGRGMGSSMEFHDRRRYEPGDDVRHIDWRAMARTDEVFVRVHREEVVPRLDLFVDVSSSMGIDGAKAQRTVDLGALLCLAARGAGFDVRIVTLGDRALRVPEDQLMGIGLDFHSARPLPDVLPEAFAQARPQSLRVLVSDFLVPMDPAQVARQLSHGAGRIALLQVLAAFDAEPTPEGAVRLTDAETGEERNVVLDAAAVSRYLDRLHRLEAGLSSETQRLGGLFGSIRADRPLDHELDTLGRSGLLE